MMTYRIIGSDGTEIEDRLTLKEAFEQFDHYFKNDWANEWDEIVDESGECIYRVEKDIFGELYLDRVKPILE